MDDVSVILHAIETGDTGAAERLLPAVYEDLRRLAQHRLGSERPGDSMQATALVHEAYLRLTRERDGATSDQRWAGRRHFFAAAATAMRRILIDRARARGAEKRGGKRARVELGDAERLVTEAPDQLLSVHEALNQLTAEDPLKGKLVELRFFAGLTIAEAADVLELSVATIERHWVYARARLFDLLSDDASR